VISFLVCTVWWMGHHMFIHDLARRFKASLPQLHVPHVDCHSSFPDRGTRPSSLAAGGHRAVWPCLHFGLRFLYGDALVRVVPRAPYENGYIGKRASPGSPHIIMLSSQHGAAAAVGYFHPLPGLFCYAAIPAVYSAIRLVKRHDGGVGPAGV
jgi:hypothetical protein